VEQRGVALERTVALWASFDELHERFCDWLSRAEATVSQMETVDGTSDMRLITEQVQHLKVRLGIDDIILILQQNRLRWYGHVLRKEDTNWVKKCTDYEVEGSRPRGRPKRTWRLERSCKKVAKHVI